MIHQGIEINSWGKNVYVKVPIVNSKNQFRGPCSLTLAWKLADVPCGVARSTLMLRVGIGPRSEGGFGLTVSLDIALPGLDKAQAEALVAKAHQVCPYSNATRGNIDVTLNVEVFVLNLVETN